MIPQRQAAAKSPRATGGTVLQRKCQCDDHTAAEDKCDTCSGHDGLLQRYADRTVDTEWLSDAVERTPGMPARSQVGSRSDPDFSGIPLVSPRDAPAFPAPHSGPFIVQPKLVVGHVNDPLEGEADRTADRVMRMPTPGPPQVSRKCGCEEDALRRQQAGPAIGGGAAPTLVHDVLRRPGRRLDAATRAFFEPRFGCDLSHVRVSTDNDAAESAVAVGARAYTVGDHIVFGRGQFAPNTHEGRRLIAHELTHVVQQAGGTGMVAREPAAASGQPPVEVQPRTLMSTVKIDTMSDRDIVTEIELLDTWFGRRVETNPEIEGRALTSMSALGNELIRRHPDIVSAVREQLSSDPAGGVALALAPGGGRIVLSNVTRTGVQVAGQRAAQVAATTTAGSGATAATATAGGISLLGLGLWGLLIFIFFAPRGENLDPNLQTAIARAIQTAAKPKAAPAPAAKPQQRALPVPAVCTQKARELSQSGCNFIAIDPKSDPLGRRAGEAHPHAELYCQSHTSGEPCEYWLYPPGGAFGTVQEWARYDAYHGGELIECKCGYERDIDAVQGGGLPFEAASARRTLDNMIKQALQHQRRAADCGVKYKMIVSSQRLKNYLLEHGPHDLEIEVRQDELCD